MNPADGESTNQPNDLHRAVNLVKRRLTTVVINALLAVGLTDGEMATAVGVPLEAVMALRNAMKLPKNRVPAFDAGHDRLTLLRAMHGVGCEDAGMARTLQLSVRKVAALRDEYDLAENVVVSDATDACWRHYTRGRTDTEIAAATGLTPAEVARWRDRHGLLPTG